MPANNILEYGGDSLSALQVTCGLYPSTGTPIDVRQRILDGTLIGSDNPVGCLLYPGLRIWISDTKETATVYGLEQNATGDTWSDWNISLLSQELKNSIDEASHEPGSIVIPGVYTQENIMNYLYGHSGSGGVSDYTELVNKPSLNSVEIDGAMSSEDLSLARVVPVENIETIDSETIDGLNKGDVVVDSSNAYLVLERTASSLIMFTSSGSSIVYLEYRYDDITGRWGYENGTSVSIDSIAYLGEGSYTSGDLVEFDESGELVESGFSVSDLAKAVTVVEISETDMDQEISKDTIYNAGELDSLTVSLPDTVGVDFISQINFTSGSTATVFTGPNDMHWIGLDSSGSVFLPTSEKRYTIMFYSDGDGVVGAVQGYPITPPL